MAGCGPVVPGVLWAVIFVLQGTGPAGVGLGRRPRRPLTKAVLVMPSALAAHGLQVRRTQDMMTASVSTDVAVWAVGLAAQVTFHF